METAPKTTPLHAEHARLGARLVEFGGWEMPVQYTGIIEEHQAVRTALGVFDISHMGEFTVRGPAAESWLNSVLTNNVERLEPGVGQYTFLLNEAGGVIDDLLIYRLGPEHFWLVVNAAKIDEDFAWMHAHLAGDVTLENVSDSYGGLAVQGPKASQLYDDFFDGRYHKPAHNEILTVKIDDAYFFIARTGYTGEDGFEVFFPAERSLKTFQDIITRGEKLGIKPCGLGARDTLRLEMCYPLNGSDLSPTRTPLEAGLSIFVDLNKGDFLGRAALVQQKEAGIPTRLVPFKMRDKSPPPRPHYPVWIGGAQIGEVASGTQSPSLGIGIGMAYVPVEFAKLGEELEIEIRGRRYLATIERKPLYKKMTTPADLLYAASHEWIRLEGDLATVGITDHAQAELTDIVFAEPPTVGRAVTAGEACAVVESVKAASDIYAPVSGTVTEINEALSSNPALINTDAFGEGWLFKVKLSDPGETAALKTPEAYAAQIG